MYDTCTAIQRHDVSFSIRLLILEMSVNREIERAYHLV
jgi:hypothetical protein